MAQMPGDSVKMLRYELFFNEVLKMQLLLLWQQGGHSTTAQLEISQDIKGNFSKKKKKKDANSSGDRLSCL